MLEHCYSRASGVTFSRAVLENWALIPQSCSGAEVSRQPGLPDRTACKALGSGGELPRAYQHEERDGAVTLWRG